LIIGASDGIGATVRALDAGASVPCAMAREGIAAASAVAARAPTRAMRRIRRLWPWRKRGMSRSPEWVSVEKTDMRIFGFLSRG
jgi:hypothetical protein